MRELHYKLTPANIDSSIEINYPSYRLYIDKSEIGENENERQKHNLYASARANSNIKDFVVDLSNQGYFLVDHQNGISTFEKFVTAENFIHNLANENLQIFNDLFYTLEMPKINTKNPRLLIVFSSVADFPLNASISRRNFFTNFATIGKYLPQNTYILRISDIGGVVGSFYMNNNFSDRIESDVQDLIASILLKNHIDKSDVVLYGASKGGTAALYHAVLGSYNAVCVDPIVSNEYHEKKYNDAHFTIGTFPETKQKKFKKLMKHSAIKSNINIIYSKNSPIFNDISTIIRGNDKKEKIKYFTSNHPEIKDHPDVGPNTINLLMMLITNLYYRVGSFTSKDIVY